MNGSRTTSRHLEPTSCPSRRGARYTTQPISVLDLARRFHNLVAQIKSALQSLGAAFIFCLQIAPGVAADTTNTTASAKNQALAPRGDFSHLLQFLDGASLHGRLQAMDTNRGVQWEHPAAKNEIDFKPEGIALIRFENVQRIGSESKPTCWFQFNNGDEVFGSLKSLETEKLRLETWFGGDLEAPRDALRAITFFPKGFAILYEGPSGPDGWNMTQGPKGWRYRDGAFVANSVGVLGRNLNLSGSCSIEFDLAWSGHFSLSFILFTDAVDRFDYSVSSYMFHLAPGYVNLQRVQTGTGVMSLGHQAQIPDMLRKNKVRIEIRANREDATIALLMDGVLISQWKDHAGFVAKGSGVVFSSQMEGPTIRLGRFRVSQWNGTIEPRPAPVGQVEEDLVYLANRDKVTGELRGIQDGKLAFTIPQTTLEIPVERVTQIFFARSAVESVARKPWELRFDVAGGGTVSFRLEKWSEDRIAGTSSNFGRMAINLASIRQIQFNAKPPKETDDLDGPSIEIWDLDE
ncbi:MAG: hypothetical protein HY735_13325 [Verrucomicrobia bacterium]|nr:hypothetical protein [Verrucomicrobiota bacterium]